MTKRSVLLPTGRRVSVSNVPQKWWSVHEGNGYVNPLVLAPDPGQPRNHIRKQELDELTQSVSEKGVREVITVTPRAFAPWVKLEKIHSKSPLIIVSGHRRTKAAIAANVGAVPVRVQIYESEKDHRVDASVLNKDRENLTPLEEGWEIVRLQKLGARVDELAKAFGYALPQLYNRIYLTQLHPDIQKLLDPTVDERQRLPATLAGHLGSIKAPSLHELNELHMLYEEEIRGMSWLKVAEPSKLEGMTSERLRFELQRVLLAVVLKRSLKSVRATAFIRDRKLQLKAHSGAYGEDSERFKPKNRRAIVETLIGQVVGSVVMDWKPEEFNRIFELQSREDIEKSLALCTRGRKLMEEIEAMLSRLRERKKPTSPEVARLMARSKVVAATV